MTRRVAVVEDDAELRGMICEALADDGFAALPFESGEAFTGRLAERQDTLAAMIVDVNLGGMDGFETVRVTRLTLPDLPVVFVSGDLRPLIRATGARQLSLMKPFTTQSLRQVMLTLLE